METIIEVLEHISDNLNDRRITIDKKLKYGHKYYGLRIELPSKSSFEPCLSVDNRNFVIEIEYGFGNTAVIESEELSKLWIEKLEHQYQLNLPNKINSIITTAISETEPGGIDFWRDFKMKKLFENTKE